MTPDHLAIMNASSADIDWIIRRSTEMPDNPGTWLLTLLALAFVGALAFMIFKDVLGYFTHRDDES